MSMLTQSKGKEVEVGQYHIAPCGHRGIIVWVSENKCSIAVKCTERHKEILKTWGHVNRWSRKRVRITHPIYLLNIKES